jgi:hypothetical protein
MTADESAVSPVIFNEDVVYWLVCWLVGMRDSDEGVDRAQSGTTPGLSLCTFPVGRVVTYSCLYDFRLVVIYLSDYKS